MAPNLCSVVEAYSFLQKNAAEDDVIALTTKKGRITIPLFQMMAFVGIVEEDLLLQYEQYIRNSPETASFRSMVSLVYDKFPRGRNRKFTFDLIVDKDVQLLTVGHSSPPEIVTHTPSPVKVTRVSGKKIFSKATISRHSKPIHKRVEEIFSSEIPTGNSHLRLNVTQDILKRLNNKLPKETDDSISTNSAIVANIKQLILSMRTYGHRDREQNTFMEHIALAICGNVPLAKLEASTGLSRRILEHGRDMRIAFDVETEKAKSERKVDAYVTPPESTVEKDSDSEGEGEDEHSDDEMVSIGSRKRRMTADAEDPRAEIRNRFRDYFSSKSRKVRKDIIMGTEVQLFCHESPLGGRIDTLRMARQQLLLEQPLGGFEYENSRVFQFPVVEMHKQFLISEYGGRQRVANKGNDLSVKRFRELICPCMSDAKQRDTADETVAEMKHCLQTWEGLRKKDPNVKAQIILCRATECHQHKEATESADLYSKASKTTSGFLTYILCPQIQREQLSIQVMIEPSTFAADMEAAKSSNISAAVKNKRSRDENFRASGAKKGSTKKLKKERQSKVLPTRAAEPGFGWYQKKCCELKCPDCGIDSRFHSGDAVDVSATAAAENATEDYSNN